jgi:hypothetical protein
MQNFFCVKTEIFLTLLCVLQHFQQSIACFFQVLARLRGSAVKF